MKKYLALLLAILAVFSLAACGKTTTVIVYVTPEPAAASVVTPVPAAEPAQAVQSAAAQSASSQPKTAEEENYENWCSFVAAHDSSVTVPPMGAFLSASEERYIAEPSCNSVNVRSDPDGDVIFTINSGETVTILATMNSYSLVVTQNNAVGWIYSTYLVSEINFLMQPNKHWMLDEAQLKFVKSKHGNCIYITYDPYGISEHFDTVDEGAAVWVIAEHGSRSFVETESGTKGWVTSGLLIY